jgi:hypothetical protein
MLAESSFSSGARYAICSRGGSVSWRQAIQRLLFVRACGKMLSMQLIFLNRSVAQTWQLGIWALEGLVDMTSILLHETAHSCVASMVVQAAGARAAV